MKTKIYGILSAVFLAIGISSIVAGCRKSHTCPQYEPVNAYRTDSVRSVAHQSDSVWTLDSVFLFIKGDTVVKQSYRDRVRYRVRVDTLLKSVRDTVRLEKRVEVEKPFTVYDRVRLNLGSLFILICSFFILYRLVGLWKKFK